MDVGMVRMRSSVLLTWLGCLALVAGCESSPSDPAPASVGATLDAIGRRLSHSYSETKLTSLSAHAPALLETLTGRERQALARGELRFQIPRPLVVEVAAPESSVPFWIQDQGFVPTGLTLRNQDGPWRLFRKRFPAGWVGLGVNGLDRKPRAHYVAFVRAEPGATPIRAEDLKLAEGSDGRWRAVTAHPAVSAASDVERPFESLPEPLTDAVLLQPRHDRRHAAMLATGRVWKTHVPSSEVPDQVTIAFGSDPARELVWSWRTAPEVEGTAIRLRPAGFESVESESRELPDLGKLRVEQGESRLIRSPNLLNDPLIRRHSVKVSRLHPDTMYFYSLGDGTSGRWGPWRIAKTGRAGGRIEFLYMGDAQTGLESWGKRLIAACRRHPGIEFLLLAGDLVDRGNERTNWDHFFLRSAEIMDRVPLMPAVGNHEYLDEGPRLYRSFFRLPENGPQGIDANLVYHFEYGSAFFAVLDSTLAVSDDRQARRQAEWLDEALSRTGARWKFVMFHHPVYPSHPWRDTPALRTHWVPVFDKHHVDMVLQGHDHAYLRTYPLRNHRPVAGPADGTVYVVAVAGDKFCDQRSAEYIEAGFTQLSTYQTIEIDEVADRLIYRAWSDAGDVVDRLEIAKSGAGQPSLADGRRSRAR